MLSIGTTHQKASIRWRTHTKIVSRVMLNTQVGKTYNNRQQSYYASCGFSRQKSRQVELK